MTTNSTRPMDVTVASTPTNVRWRIFLLMLMLIAINYVDRASISVAMPVISKEFDIDLTTQGFILSAFFVTYALMQIPGGMLADRYKPRAVIAAATLGWGFFQAIAAVSFNTWVLVATRLGLGASEAPIYPAGGKLNAIWMTSTERARRNAARRRSAAGGRAWLRHHCGPHRGIRVLARLFRRRRRRHNALRSLSVVVHPQQPA